MPSLEPSPVLQAETDWYARPAHRWLALVAALMAWGFDGVEQNIYSLMTRDALKDLLPQVAGLVQQTAALREAGADAALIKPIARQIDQVVGQYFSLSMALWLWGAAVGGIVFGRFGDRFGRVKGLLLSVTTYSLFTGLSAISTHWTMFMGCRFFGAIGLGGTWPLAVALVVETWPENRRAVLAGCIGAAANVGMFIAATYSRYMVQWGIGWRWIVGTGMFMAMLSLPVIAIVHEPTKWRLARGQRKASRLAEVFSPEYRRATIVGSLLSTVALLGAWGSFLWFATHVDQITEGTAYAGKGKTIMSQWMALGQISGGFLGGMLAGWLGNRRSWVLLCITAWGSVVTLCAVMTEFHVEYAALAAVAGVFVTAFFGWLPKFLPELYPTHIRATGQGFAYNIGRVLAGFGVLGTGTMVGWFGGQYRLGMMAMATVYLLGLIVILFVPKRGFARPLELENAAAD